MEVWTGFAVGLLGSLHCVGMCGPIVLALPVFGESQFKIMLGRILYNLGRVATYSFMGAMFGLFGNRLVLFGLQQNLSIILGAIIMIYILTPRKIKTKVSELKFYKSITTFIKTNFFRLASRKNASSLFAIGLLNGLLPCGFVYVGIAGAISTGDVLSGTLYMALFGLGTLPIMFATALFGKIINLNIRRRLAKMVPAFAFILAALFILRGLNLGIPYISPKLVHQPAQTQQEPNCCE
ncbi:MAG: sulfite exporter TauE/SafE family protein [Bacteroidetes bacterium]|nr:sulfite exporter TauE/SafE family protein [Bacteroidota bacterium]MCL6099346.1 sulfite exporter TauE/SafE family protein [Bacteroidota bacterium]